MKKIAVSFFLYFGIFLFVSPESLSAPSAEDSPVRAGKTTTLQYNKELNYISRPCWFFTDKLA